MAVKVYGHDIDLAKLSEILNFKIHNVTTATRGTLAGTLTTTHKGLSVWDTDLSLLYCWNGSAFVAQGGISGAMTFKGIVAFGATEPSSPATGDTYVFSTAGTNTWNTSDVVQIGDSAIWNGTDWSFIQGNVLAASESVAGVMEIATDAEMNTGTDDSRAATPLKVKNYIAARALAKVYFNASVTLVANTPLTVTHGLALQNRNSFVCEVKDSGHSVVGVDIDSTDVNNITLTSAIAGSGYQVTIIGF